MGMFSWLAEFIGGVELSTTEMVTDSVSCATMDTTADSHSSDCASSPEWHNAFGTLADHQVPAEQYDIFQTNDWSTMSDCSSSTGTFGSDW